MRAVKSSDPRFEAAAIESVSQWAIDPGVSDGAHAAMGVSVKLHFRLPEKKHGSVPPEESTIRQLPKTEAKADSNPNPEYPADLLARQISGEAVVDFMVEPDGSVSAPRVLGVNHPGFVRPALEAIQRLTFTPAKQGDLPVRAKMRSPMEFAPFVMNRDTETRPHLEVNGFSLRLAEGQTQKLLCDRAPILWTVPDVLYPRGLALAGVEGEATLEFDLDERGNPGNIHVISATAPEFGHALADSLSAGVFKPALKNGRNIPLPMRWTHAFRQPAAEPAEDEGAEARLIRLLRSGGVVASAKGLDAPLKPLWRISPAYPDELRTEGLRDTVQVEFIIDQEGRVRLPFVVAAANEKFGRAALIAASLWVFDAPTRGGQPTDVRVRVPFQFAP